jgi:hypothetical protein
MFANWLATVFYTQVAVLTFKSSNNNNHINISWIYILGALALCSHAWIITTYNVSNQATSFSIIFASIAYLLIRYNKIAKIVAFVFIITAISILTSIQLQIKSSTIGTTHLIFASILMCNLIYAALQAINIIQQNNKLKLGQVPSPKIPALELLEQNFYRTSKILLVITIITVITSFSSLQQISLSPQLIINIALTLTAISILFIIIKSKQKNLVKSKNSILMLIALIFFAIICVTCILLRR